ncbi:MEKHLA domain-containing protein [Streptomyces chiangmaiensis]|uniref:MEKHLA domain-containing protein n=1 Tax=Streptomyces chiangmaiensis TaxID=766497 RepID=A0ABU7FGG3_9ACTN|nr:MEKHLA domain-containing protein [Streptomyces chiangmaiensis]MED7823081.1 MEKHLA domain-containing protein [Streptomyces chiangmaiensis]
MHHAHLPQGAGPAFAQLLLSSYERQTGRPLCPTSWSSDGEAAEWLYWQAPFGLLAHDTADDPVFVYANRTAQNRFDYTWQEFTVLPSRLSAAPDAQAGRNSFIASVADNGYASGYRGLRRARTGRRFWIEDVTMWNVTDAGGVHHGQAAVFHSSTDA